MGPWSALSIRSIKDFAGRSFGGRELGLVYRLCLQPQDQFNSLRPPKDRLRRTLQETTGLCDEIWFRTNTLARESQDKAYFLKSDDRVNPKASPTLMDLKTFPKTVFISVGDADLLYNESKEFIEKLNKDGHPDAVMLTMEGEGHAFDKEATNEIAQKNVKEFDEAMIEAIKRGWKNQIGSA